MGHEAKHPIIIGITGNIGSGKSTVAALLRSWGYPVLDLDALAARARENKEEELKRLFPEAVVGGGWTGGPLARLVFSDPERLKALGPWSTRRSGGFLWRSFPA